MKIKKAFLVSVSTIIFFLIFILDILRKTHDPEKLGLLRIRQILIFIGFVSVYFLFDKIEQKRDKSLVAKVGNVLLLSAGILVSLGLVSRLPNFQFSFNDSTLIPNGYPTIIFSSIFSILVACCSIYLLVLIKNFVFSYRKKNTKRNFILLVLLICITSVYYHISGLYSSNVYLSLLLFLTFLLMLSSSFRLPWIVYLTKKEKYYTIAYSVFILPLIITATVINGSSTIGNEASEMLFFFSPFLKEFVFLMTLFTSTYFGLAFVSTIFHLPTQDVFDRKILEISSLHNLSRLVTQIFDFRDLVENITKLAINVCEADCAWIEIRKENKASDNENIKPESYDYELVSNKNITIDEISILNSIQDTPFYKQVYLDRMDRKLVYINDLTIFKNRKVPEELYKKIRSLVVVPLISHSELIGILFIGKSFAYGFDKEYLNIISTFADQVTISIENSQLIQRSLEKERMERELLLAQKMQRKLLPQEYPSHVNLDLCAISIPAYEVGGDYYDFSKVGNDKLGIIVGDVSGKGISAAFYMAVVKGIFQALTKVYSSPKEFLIKTNLALNGHIEKKSFVSLIYGILDLSKGKLYLSRAGHCPMIYVTESEARYIKPEGLGVGLDNGKIFDNITEEVELLLDFNSVCVFYTDGISESRNKSGEEFGYDLLLETVKKLKEKSSSEICTEILVKIKEFTQNETELDDITLVIFKWKGNK